MDLPIVCTLTTEEMRERRRTVLSTFKQAVIKSEELPDGFAFSFAPLPGVLAQLSQIVELERHCCRFLTFKIVVESGEKPIRLEVTGAPEAKAVIYDFFR